ncbi:MAG: hypothetical protein HY220_00505 [Candidatus Sungbacteria bacterium]|uniref:Uncharacterized protein n=1 Tax=Candidatus Sungiibacteriota bacterium TaxID=2750080 RepID=A0A9D6QRP8_9BACT|nr:hypothetical protein [Candidatus Sungbacteria bacterium]
MKNLTFFIKLGIFLGLLSLAVFLISAIGHDSNSAAAVILDKHALLAGAPSPKIILVGGSNITYGIDSLRIERDVGRPVVNMGYSLGVGLRFALEEVKPDLKKGDAVLVIPEYEQFQDLFEGNGAILDLVQYDPSLARHITSWRQVREMVKYFPNFLQNNFKRGMVEPLFRRFGLTIGKSERRYYRSDFNAAGDLVGYLKDPRSDSIDISRLNPGYINPAAIEALSNFTAFAKQKGAPVVFIFPSYSTPAYQENKDTVNAIYKKLQQIRDLVIPDSPSDFIFSTGQLFDSSYHLVGAGREDRTSRIIAKLKTVLAH